MLISTNLYIWTGFVFHLNHSKVVFGKWVQCPEDLIIVELGPSLDYGEKIRLSRKRIQKLKDQKYQYWRVEVEVKHKFTQAMRVIQKQYRKNYIRRNNDYIVSEQAHIIREMFFKPQLFNIIRNQVQDPQYTTIPLIIIDEPIRRRGTFATNWKYGIDLTLRQIGGRASICGKSPAEKRERKSNTPIKKKHREYRSRKAEKKRKKDKKHEEEVSPPGRKSCKIWV